MKSYILRPTTDATLVADQNTVLFRPFNSHDGEPGSRFNIEDLTSPEAGIDVMTDGKTARLWPTQDAKAQIVLEGIPGWNHFVITNGDCVTVIGHVIKEDSKGIAHRKLVITTNSADLQARLESMEIMPYMKAGLEWVNTVHLAVIRRVNRKVADAFTAWRKAEFIKRQSPVVETVVMPIGSGEEEQSEDVVLDHSAAPLAIKEDRNRGRNRDRARKAS